MPSQTFAISRTLGNDKDWDSIISNERDFVHGHLIEPYSQHAKCSKVNFRSYRFHAGSSNNTIAEIQKENKISLKIKHSELSNELSHIEEAIQEARQLLELESNWDGEGAIKIPLLIFNRAIQFLKSYSVFLKTEYSCIIIAPEITPLKNGSIDLYWKIENASLLINIKNGKDEIAYYYGELYNHNKQAFDINGQIPTDTTLDMFASWFTCFSKMEKGKNK